MTIERGADWGTPGGLPADGVVVRSDAEANEVITAARRARKPIPVLGLAGGDLCRTLGGTGDVDRLRSAAAHTFPIDLGVVLLDGRLQFFCSHLVVRSRWWSGRCIVVMNAQFLGPYDLAPRGHPNDGYVEVTEGALPLGERLRARTRARTGTHLPHPALHTSRVEAMQFELDRPTPVRIDSICTSTAQNISLRVEPDALLVVV